MSSFFSGPIREGSIRLVAGNPGRITLDFWTPADDEPPVHIDSVVLNTDQGQIVLSTGLDIVGQRGAQAPLTVPALIEQEMGYELVVRVGDRTYSTVIFPYPGSETADPDSPSEW